MNKAFGMLAGLGKQGGGGGAQACAPGKASGRFAWIGKKSGGGGGAAREANNYREYVLTREERAKYYAIFAAGAAVLGILFFDSVIASAALALCSVPAERHYRRMMAARLRGKLSAEFGDMLHSLSASFQTGRQMGEALVEARDSLAQVFPPSSPINRELDHMVRRITAGGESEREALFDFAARTGNEDARHFADVYYTCLTTGGDTIKVVNRTAEALAEKMAIRREIETLTSQKRYEAKILTVVPIMILVFLRMNSPDYLVPLYTTPAGVCIMALALAALAASYVWSGRIMDIEI